MMGFSRVGCNISITASQHSRLKSSSAVEKVSGEYSKCQSVSGCLAASSRMILAASMAICLICGRSMRSEEHTSELQSLMRISYAVFCLKKKKNTKMETNT